MNVALIGVDAPEWSELVRETPHDFYHLPAYARLCAAFDGGVAKALLVTDGSRRLLLPMLVRDLPGGRLDAVSPYGYPGPLAAGTDGPSFVGDALREATRSLRDEGFVSLFVRLHPLLDLQAPEGVGTLVEHGETVSVDLTLPAEATWHQTRRDHRHDITTGLRMGWRARMDEDWGELEAFKRLYAATMARLSAASRYRFDDSYFDGLRRALGDRLHLCVVEADGAVAAAGLFVEASGIVQFHLSGSDDAFSRPGPTKLMLHFVEGWARGRGDQTLHLGGGVGGRSDSLFAFKSGFSPLRHPFRTMRLVIDEREYRRRVAAHDATLDPDDTRGYFPAYRRK